MSKTLTYWQFISTYRIEIPVIQRDYAQGRDEEKINALRKNFLTDIFNKIKDPDQLMHLGFIYGKIEGKDKYHERQRNKRAIENILNAVEGYAKQLEMSIKTDLIFNNSSKSDEINLPTFIPLDGQQRLTTLYLVHWYLSLISNSDNDQTSTYLGRFSYKTRKSSYEFCKAITNSEIRKDLKENLDKSISSVFINRKWFRREWLKDSTVKGMITVLDEIQLQVEPIRNKENFFDVLIKQDAPIRFDFLDLDELNQTDELYVKMNARGKQLSEFEHFKAWLIQWVKKNNIKIEVSNWKTKIDKDWLDLFWKAKDEHTLVDDTMYNFFKQIGLFAYIQKDFNESNLEFTRTIRETKYVPFSIYEKYNFFNVNTLNFIFKTLERLCDEQSVKEYQDWLKKIACAPFISDVNFVKTFINNANPVERTHSVFYYSFLVYINHFEEQSQKHFRAWMRMTRNLLYNTYVQTPRNYVDAILGIKNLLPHINLLVSGNKGQISIDMKSIRFFGDKLFRHEMYKVGMCNQNGNYHNLIDKYENHDYFRGDIRLIMSMAFNGLDHTNIDSFQFYGDRLSKLFNYEIRHHKEHILQRALLSKGFYLQHIGSNFQLCLPNAETLRSRRDNWQKVFESEKGRMIIKKLIDEELVSDHNVEFTLENVINSYDKDTWDYYLIKNHRCISFCSNGFIRITGISSFDSKPDVYLLRTSKLYGRHAELHSYFQYVEWIQNLNTIDPFQKLYYWENRMNQYEYPCVFFKGYELEGIEHNLDITYSYATKYKFVVRTDDRVNQCSQRLVVLLENLSWEFIQEKEICVKQGISKAEIKDFLMKLLNDLISFK